MSIKKHLLNTLNCSEILNLTGDKRVHFLHANNPKIPYLEYEVISENGEEFAESREIYTNYLIQVDIFSKGDYTELEEIIKKEMLKAGYCRDQAVDMYEKDTKLYHKAMRFNISLPY
ncbi:prohead protease [Eubacterium multiforme]|uniref:prohead protease n=1 Tax=Eubacterium multiforme TaxID=83339 RepID=UPI0027D7E64D|nr:prohead protease [Eubacterium multiforme]